MNIYILQELIEQAEQSIREAEAAEDKEQSQYWRGRADSYREMLDAEIALRSRALYKSKCLAFTEGTPAFIKAYNLTATALGLPLLATAAA